jgi:hypothetical protein
MPSDFDEELIRKTTTSKTTRLMAVSATVNRCVFIVSGFKGYAIKYPLVSGFIETRFCFG